MATFLHRALNRQPDNDPTTGVSEESGTVQGAA